MNIATTLSGPVPAARSSDASDNTFNCVSRYVHTLPETASIKHGEFGDWSAWAWNATCTIVGCCSSMLLEVVVVLLVVFAVTFYVSVK